MRSGIRTMEVRYGLVKQLLRLLLLGGTINLLKSITILRVYLSVNDKPFTP